MQESIVPVASPFVGHNLFAQGQLLFDFFSYVLKILLMDVGSFAQ